MAKKALDLFAGAGGWGVALDSLGVTAIGVDTDKDACTTARAAGHWQINMDVRDLDSGCAEGLGLVASPPCQTWSQAGNRPADAMMKQVLDAVRLVGGGMPVTEALDEAGDIYVDERTALVLEPMRIIAGSRPPWVALEQVPPVFEVWCAYDRVLTDMGYWADFKLLSAEQYGVPQTRRRAFLIASLEREVILPDPTHSGYYPNKPEFMDPGVLPWLSMAEALGHEPEAAVPGDTSWTFRRPSPTIVGSFAPDVVAAPGWRKPGDPPRQKTPGSVRVTVEEAGILQGFPADYPWQGSETSRRRQVGNAVPPPLARAVLAEVI